MSFANNRKNIMVVLYFFIAFMVLWFSRDAVSVENAKKEIKETSKSEISLKDHRKPIVLSQLNLKPVHK